MNVHLSELKQRVKIFRPVATEDGVGNLIEQGRTEVATVWAMVLPYAAKISDGYAEKVDEVTYRVVICCKNVSAKTPALPRTRQNTNANIKASFFICHPPSWHGSLPSPSVPCCDPSRWL